MSRAIDLLPAELKPFFEHYRDEIVVRVGRSRPVAQRRLGGRSESLPRFRRCRSSARIPFAELPREYGAALEKFGADHAEAQRPRCRGAKPKMFGNLRRAFEGFARDAPYAAERRRAVCRRRPRTTSRTRTSRFTRTVNYDGQLTGNDGIHARFERDLFERFESRLTVNPPRPDADPQPARRRVRRAARELPARRRDSEGRQRGRRRQGRPTTTSTTRRFSPRCARCSSGASANRSRRPPG